jgi:hypothetical protein
MASFVRFLDRGEVGQVRLGMDQVEALVYLGDPPVFVGSPTIIGANVWRYGDLELEFHHHTLTRLTIFTSSRTELPNEVGNSLGFPTCEWTTATVQEQAEGVSLTVAADSIQSPGAFLTLREGKVVRMDARAIEP